MVSGMDGVDFEALLSVTTKVRPMRSMWDLWDLYIDIYYWNLVQKWDLSTENYYKSETYVRLWYIFTYSYVWLFFKVGHHNTII